MIPSQLKFSMEGATPSFADNEGQIVEAGSQVRLRIKGIRSELNQMYAIGSIREDYLGYERALFEATVSCLRANRSAVLLCSDFRRRWRPLRPLAVAFGKGESWISLHQVCFGKRLYHYLGLQRGVGEISPKQKRENLAAREVKKLFTFFMSYQDTQIGIELPEFKSVLSSSCVHCFNADIYYATLITFDARIELWLTQGAIVSPCGAE